VKLVLATRNAHALWALRGVEAQTVAVA